MTRQGFRIAELIATLLVLAVFIACVSTVIAPWEAFRALRAAALANDVRGMTEVMDEGAVRAAFRAERGGYTASPMQALLGLQGAPPDVEGLMTPQAMVHFSHGGPHQPGQPFRIGNLLPGLHDSEIRYWGPNRARIAALAQGPGENLFTFERRGIFKWRLTAIHTPRNLDAGRL